jgi:hypothetical protein
MVRDDLSLTMAEARTTLQVYRAPLEQVDPKELSA